MERYERFYSHFERPPLAPVYYPTPEEFTDPIAYVAKIRPEAEKYGVVKIVPPECFKPAFAIDRSKFMFTPRVQKLNEVEAICRERASFMERISNYWELQGITFRLPVLDNKTLDLFKAHYLVRLEGGFEDVCQNKRWTAVAKSLGMKSNQAGSKLKDHYAKIVLPFINNVEKKELKMEEEEDVKPVVEEKKEDDKRGLGEGRSSMQGGSRGTKTRVQHKKKDKKGGASEKCCRCLVTDGDDKIVTCENCDMSIHYYCLKPSLREKPKAEWRCAECAEKEVRMLGTDFGFYDSATSYTLDTFSDYANDFKREYFKKEPEEVHIDEIEKIFWKKVLDATDSISVKYGADLISNRVGSGFVRKSDERIRPSDRNIANHPWNLNNMPVLTNSVLSHFDAGISGMMVPWVYVGMCFSTFCWHTEDHWTYSVNYNHWGEPKIWYGINADEAEKFEGVVRTLCPSLIRLQPDLLHHMTIAVNPHFLRSQGVHVTTVHQKAGEFVITFPRAYHAGFNQGLNFAEAVNFAPIDWLRLGRQCMSSYATVRRCCVFAHDELVLKMVNKGKKLSVSMAVAALEELKEVSTREAKLRHAVGLLGVRRTSRIEFESIPDDGRVCRVCNTTLFMSALLCSHGKYVCLEHTDKLCHKCPISECVLQYRYSLEELIPLVDQLKARTKSYDDWEAMVEKIVAPKGKKSDRPSYLEAERLVETARVEHFPSSPLLTRITVLYNECQPTVCQARGLLEEKIRVRNKTRIQRADTRLDLNGVKVVRKKLDTLPLECTQLTKNLSEVVSKLEKWEARARAEIDGEFDEERVRVLVEEAQELEDYRLDLLPILSKLSEREQWIKEQAKPFISWRATDGMELADEFLTRFRWSIEDLDELMKEGVRLGAERTIFMDSLTSMRRDAYAHNEKALKLFRKDSISSDEVLKLWDEVKESDWCSAPGLDALRVEVDAVMQLRSYDRGSDCTWTDLVRSIDLCEKSRSMNNSEEHGRFSVLIKEMSEFTKALATQFIPRCSYFSLYELVSLREDIVALAEAQRPQLTLHDRELAECWMPLDRFDCRDELEEHMKKVLSQQDAFFNRLRWTNEQLPVHKTCPCLRSLPQCEVFVCLVCRSKTHDKCASWHSFLARLPPGSFLCVRCLRSMRPAIEDVEAITRRAPAKALEATLVQFMVSTVVDVSKETRTRLQEWKERKEDEGEEGANRLSHLILSLLSMECFDSSLLALLTQPISILFRDILEAQRPQWDALRIRPMPAKLPEVLFAVQKRGRGYSSPPKKRPRKMAMEDDQVQICAHPECLQPYNDELTWVQCERCKLWLHVICTGEILDPDKNDYECVVCRNKERKKLHA